MVVRQEDIESYLKSTVNVGVGEHHKGDIGNFTADANGNGTITMTTDQWDIDQEIQLKIF
jgi:Cu/Zn superoxide dismutase